MRNADELRAELARVRAQGYALTSAELEEGLISAAAPVRDATGTVVGVLACSTSTARHTPGEFRELAAECLMKSAHALGADLGYRG